MKKEQSAINRFLDKNIPPTATFPASLSIQDVIDMIPSKAPFLKKQTRSNSEVVERVFDIKHEKAWIRASTTSRVEYERQLRELTKRMEKHEISQH